MPRTDAEEWLARRQELGQDKRDECYGGVYHVNPPQALGHAKLADRILIELTRLLMPKGYEVSREIGIYLGESWVIPDVTVWRPDQANEQETGLTSAELVVEVNSPGEDPERRAGVYAETGVTEWLTVFADHLVLRSRGGDGWAVAPDGTSELGLRFRLVEGRIDVAEVAV